MAWWDGTLSLLFLMQCTCGRTRTWIPISRGRAQQGTHTAVECNSGKRVFVSRDPYLFRLPMMTLVFVGPRASPASDPVAIVDPVPLVDMVCESKESMVDSPEQCGAASSPQQAGAWGLNGLKHYSAPISLSTRWYRLRAPSVS